jgi:hypothetical protein
MTIPYLVPFPKLGKQMMGIGMRGLTDEAVIPLSTLDPAAPLDDLGWLDRVVGDARVVAIGESAH